MLALAQKKWSRLVSKIQGIRGFNDVLPEETIYWEKALQTLMTCLKRFAYQEIKLPLIEQTALFKRTIGDVTDIVEKEMYTFVDLNGESISLRPEGTAGCVRSLIEHGLLRQPQKLWYFGPMFRHEKPQKGRYRQFYQLGVEVFGIENPAADLELLAMTHEMWNALNIDKKVTLELNCLGTLSDRNRYRDALVAYFEKHLDLLTPEEVSRLRKNPLRLLDSKSESIAQILVGAPRLLDYVNESSKQNFELLCLGLTKLGIPFVINPFLVRGLDYYNHLVFEWVTKELGSQATVCAGGRYDSLVEQLGGPATPAIGFAMGIERILLLMQQSQLAPPIDVYVLTQEEQPLVESQKIAGLIRQQLGWQVELNLSGSSMKSQFKKADKSGARFALILGADELENKQISVKFLRGNIQDDRQICLNQNDLLAWLQQQHGEKVC
jgi:histidyl-tRNA synthetase